MDEAPQGRIPVLRLYKKVAPGIKNAYQGPIPLWIRGRQWLPPACAYHTVVL
jgi:hypothetical protein